MTTNPSKNLSLLISLLSNQDLDSVLVRNLISGELSLTAEGGSLFVLNPNIDRNLLAYGSRIYWSTNEVLLGYVTNGFVEPIDPNSQGEAPPPAVMPTEPEYIVAPADPTNGDLIVYDASIKRWVVLPAGDTAGHVLTTNGTAQLPTYQAASGGGGLPGSPTTGDLAVYDGADWVSLPAAASGTVLTANGAGVVPSYQAAPGGVTGVETLIYNVGGNALDFDPAVPGFKSLLASGDVTFTTANLAPGRQVSILIRTLFASVNFNFPAGWAFLNGGVPASQDALKVGVLSLVSYDSDDLNIVAGYSVQP